MGRHRDYYRESWFSYAGNCLPGGKGGCPPQLTAPQARLRPSACSPKRILQRNPRFLKIAVFLAAEWRLYGRDRPCTIRPGGHARPIAIAQILNAAEALAIRRRGIERFGEMAVFCQGNLRPWKAVLSFPLLLKRNV